MDEPTLGVRELLAGVKELLDEALPPSLWVQGEIRGLTRSRPGHVYFDLVEPGDDARRPEARLPVALFASDRARIERALRDADAASLADGMEVRIQGRATLYVARSQLQLVVRAIDPSFTLGRLEQARRALLRALDSEGLLTANAAIGMPTMPRRIALITSAPSAACADTMHELEASAIEWDVRLIDTVVQGDRSPQAIARALRLAERTDAEVVLLVRGGGSRSDLVAFDSEAVARAIASCPLPVWTGIGHEIDRTVADEVAHTAHKTPTACAASLIAAVRADLERARAAWDRIDRTCRSHLHDQHAALRHASTRVERLASSRLRTEAARLAAMPSRLDHGTRTLLERQRSALALADARLAARDPQRLLQRGWSLTTAADGTIIRSVAAVQVGDVITTRLVDGAIRSTVGALSDPEGADGSEA